MARDGGLHSRIVATLRVALPLAALALLSTLFLFGKAPRNGALPFGEVDVEALLREPQMTAPTFAGVTEDGADMRLTADSARTDLAGGGSAAQPVFMMTTADGITYRVAAAEARLDPAAQLLVLSGGVTLTSSAGWTVVAASVAAALDRTFAETPGAVTADGPPGRITAGRARIDRTDAGDVLVFKGGVKLIYAAPS
ncbi:MAG: LPS export ABC transporter periplasmic protein LptC [Gemmobacter sp.]